MVEALRAYTADAARACHWEHALGSLTPGRLADLVVLADDPRRVSPSTIADIEIVTTYVDGVPAAPATGPNQSGRPDPVRTAGTSIPSQPGFDQGLFRRGPGRRMLLASDTSRLREGPHDQRQRERHRSRRTRQQRRLAALRADRRTPRDRTRHPRRPARERRRVVRHPRRRGATVGHPPARPQGRPPELARLPSWRHPLALRVGRLGVDVHLRRRGPRAPQEPDRPGVHGAPHRGAATRRRDHRGRSARRPGGPGHRHRRRARGPARRLRLRGPHPGDLRPLRRARGATPRHARRHGRRAEHGRDGGGGGRDQRRRDRLDAGPGRDQAPHPRRRHDEPAAGRPRGGRRPAQRARADLHAVPDGRRRQPDHRGPHQPRGP